MAYEPWPGFASPRLASTLCADRECEHTLPIGGGIEPRISPSSELLYNGSTTRGHVPAQAGPQSEVSLEQRNQPA